MPLQEGLCVEVTGLPHKNLDFIMVPADVAGPDAPEFDKKGFMDAVLGSGGIYEGDIWSNYYGTEAQLTTPGMKVYRYSFDDIAIFEDSTSEDESAWLEDMEITLISGATINKIDCPDAVVIEPLPIVDPDEINIEPYIFPED